MGRIRHFLASFESSSQLPLLTLSHAPVVACITIYLYILVVCRDKILIPSKLSSSLKSVHRATNLVIIISIGNTTDIITGWDSKTTELRACRGHARRFDFIHRHAIESRQSQIWASFPFWAVRLCVVDQKSSRQLLFSSSSFTNNKLVEMPCTEGIMVKIIRYHLLPFTSIENFIE